MSKPRRRRHQPEMLSPEELAAYAYHSRPDVLEAKHRHIDERLALLKAWEEAEAAASRGTQDAKADGDPH